MGKPLLFGDKTFDGDRIDEIRKVDDMWDRSYVPGYGERRRENEWLVRDGKKPVPTIRLQWIRIGHVDGREVGDRDMLEWAMNGYQFITKEELKQNGYGMPPTAYVDSQGRIRREDLALAFIDEEQAAKNVARQAQLMSRPPKASKDNPEIAWTERTDDVADIAELGAKYLDD